MLLPLRTQLRRGIAFLLAALLTLLGLMLMSGATRASVGDDPVRIYGGNFFERSVYRVCDGTTAVYIIAVKEDTALAAVKDGCLK